MKQRTFRCKHLHDFIFQFISFQKPLSRTAPKCLGQQPDYDGDNAYHENYASPDAGFEDIADEFAASERKRQQEDNQKIDVSFHGKEYLVSDANQHSKTIP